MTYSEKLKDPRWQRRRLEVMQAADFRCEWCGDASSPLHVHHLKYTGEPWDAPAEDLECLCESHHTERTELGGLRLEVIFARARASRITRFRSLMDAQFKAGAEDTLQRLIAALE